ncbi:VWA domain-containing protein [Actinophytocola sediminis]
MRDLASPGAFWLVAVVVAVAAGYAVALRRQRTSLSRFVRPELRDTVVRGTSRWRHLSSALVLVAMLLLIVGLAGPTATQRVPRNRAVVMVIVDTSPSMAATDVAPSRLAAAREAAEAFVRRLPKGVNVGLVTFAGAATVDLTPTTRHDTVIKRIRAAAVHRGTASGDALAAALTTVTQVGQLLADDQGPAPARVIMLTDGKETSGRPMADVAVEAGRTVPVDTISYGTATGEVEIDGQRIAVPPDDTLLRAVAEATGGRFHQAVTAPELAEVHRELGEQVGYENRRGDASKPWFLAGTGTLMLAAASGLLLTRRVP